MMMWYYCIIIFMVIMYPNFSTILLLGHIIAYCLRVFRGEFCIKNYCTFPKTHNHNIYTDKKQFDGLNKSDSNSSQLSYSNDETNSRSSLDSDTDTASIDDDTCDNFNAFDCNDASVKRGKCNNDVEKSLNDSSFPHTLYGFTVYSKQGVDIVETFYAWLNDVPTLNAHTDNTDHTDHTLCSDASNANVNDSQDNLNARNQLEQLLHSTYKQDSMWSLLATTHEGSFTMSCKPIAKLWMDLVSKTFVKIVNMDIYTIKQLHTKEHKIAFVANTLIPLLIKYKDIYTSPSIFTFGSPNHFYKAILVKMIEFVNINGMIEPILFIACLYPDLIHEDCHPTINSDPDVNDNRKLKSNHIQSMQYHKVYAPLMYKLPQSLRTTYA